MNATETQTETKNFDQSLESFLVWANEMKINAYNESKMPENGRDTLYAKVGKRNVKIICRNFEGDDRSVYCFIEVGSGKIMKAASWKSPEPKRYGRGNIFNPEGWAACCDPYGVAYRN